ncbi:MAG TPA: AI-2E family transporter [Rhodobacteraceae bacterium]|nr:AI-2E family transporter [Paracoccaceae bacterium]
MTNQPRQTGRVVRNCAVLLTALALLAAMELAEDIMAPLVAALVTGVIFAPAAGRLQRLGLPRVLSAALILAAGIAVIGGIALLVEPYLWRLLEELPNIKWELQKLVRSFRGLIQGLDEVNAEFAQALGDTSEPDAASAAPKMPGLTDALFLAPVILGKVVIYLGALFFFLLTRHSIYHWLSERIGTKRDTKVMLARFRNAESVISTYFLTITVINAVMGAAVAAAMTLIGLPGAIMWGIAAMLLNYVLYLGPAVMLVSLGLAGVLAFEGPLSFAPALAYLAINLTEAQFITPALVGRNISINPLMIFVSLVFWLWLWGPIGGIIAIPIMVILLKVFDIFHEHPTEEEQMLHATETEHPEALGARKDVASSKV